MQIPYQLWKSKLRLYEFYDFICKAWIVILVSRVAITTLRVLRLYLQSLNRDISFESLNYDFTSFTTLFLKFELSYQLRKSKLRLYEFYDFILKVWIIVSASKSPNYDFTSFTTLFLKFEYTISASKSPNYDFTSFTTLFVKYKSWFGIMKLLIKFS